MNNAATQSNGSMKLRDSLSDAGQQFGSTAKKVISDVSESGREVASQYIEEGRKLAEGYIEEGKKSLEGIEKFAKDRPLTAMLMGVGAGLLLARILK